jgi:DNA-binding YbaB/EbfC family protein
MNIQKLMKQAQEMQQKMQQAQATLGTRTVEASVAGGKVTVVATAAGDVCSIKIDPSIVDPADVEFLQELVLSGVQQAIEQGRALASSEMGKLTGGMGLPPGLGF